MRVSSEGSLRVVQVLAKRMASEDVWDQSAFNMEIFRPAYGSRASVGVSVRVMNFLCFLNTKLLFKHMRYDHELGSAQTHVPVTIHMNYHPEKEARMASVFSFYHGRQRNALDRWNNGEGSRRSANPDDCSGKVGVMTKDMPSLSDAEASSHTLARNVLRHGGAWRWQGKTVVFSAGGRLDVHGGGGEGGTWGTVPSPWRKDSLHVKWGGKAYLLMFLSEKWAFAGERCEDEQVTYGQLDAPSVPDTRLVF